MPPLLSFTDEEMSAITALASALPHNMRAEFLQRIAKNLSEYPMRGVGLVYRVAAGVQREFLRLGGPPWASHQSHAFVGHPTSANRMLLAPSEPPRAAASISRASRSIRTPRKSR